ncbi:MAG: molecular chaperone DnaJ [Fibrobacteria bacterium]|nr:molecular chaperone DnaJ [Fibrobacteria bacterium]
MADKRDYYEVLGVSRNASTQQLKNAYKKLAIKNHPDKNPGDKAAEDRFKEAAEAYDVLSDSKKKAQYDQFGHAGVQGMGGGGGFHNFDDIFSQFGDIFGDMFGGGGGFGGFGGRSRRPRAEAPRGEDIQIKIPLTLQEILKGATKKVKLRRYNNCKTCGGKGGSGDSSCSVCGGVGQVRQTQQSLFGTMVNVTTCPECRGRGKIIKNKCKDCYGQGREKSEVTISIDVPAGVAQGNYITLRGEGNKGMNGGASGDLLAIIAEKEDPYFERQGNDVVCTSEVQFTTVALGGEIRVKTIDGEVDLKIPAGTQSEKLFRLAGKGLPDLNTGRRGDQYVKVHVFTPSTLSVREKELLNELDEVQEHEPGDKSFFKKAKSFFK